MGICGSKPPAVKQDVPAAPAQNGSLHSAIPTVELLPPQAPPSNANVAPIPAEPVAVPAPVRQSSTAAHSSPHRKSEYTLQLAKWLLLQEVLTQSDVVQEPILSDKPLLSGIAVPADLPSQAKPPPLLSRVRAFFSVDSHIISAETLLP